MAEVKNSFLGSKMNKDLDDRLIPSNEYRDALNISVGKSEDNDVGSLVAIFGNEIMINLSNPNLKCIGSVVDNQNNRLFQFWTDYTDLSPGGLTPPSYASIVDMRITMYTANSSSGTLVTLVSGKFLNLATNHKFQITGANVIENLLFWTDNRNQPRKINILSASINPSYYTNEIQISVAKYAPVLPMSAYLDIPVTTTSLSSNPTTQSVSFTVSAANLALLNVGMQLITNSPLPVLTMNDYAVITELISAGTPATYTVIVSVPTPITIPLGSVLHFYGSSMTDKADEPNWPGDPNYLKDKYVRFSYRYKFDDGEYSLMAPFTQIMFIPNQNGYFLAGDEDSAYRSTIVSWMENFINNIGLHVELPDTGNNIENSYKIKSIDILYKESDALAIKVLETVGVNEIKLQATSTNQYTYTYKSQKPYKTLPESQTVRVYDKVHVRAKAQEIAGNRVIYGNFINKSTPPSGINYNLAIIKKNNSFTSWAEYPNHTLKQNRNYQAGIVLSDKFGRQSTVILSSNDIGKTSGGFNLVGSTLYSPYYSQNPALNVKEWRGNTLIMIINSPIVSSINEGAGTPGLYAIVSGAIPGSGDGFQIVSPITVGGVSGNSYTFTLAPATGAQKNIPAKGNYLRGKYTDYVEVINVVVSPITTPPAPLPNPPSGSYTITTSGDINDIYNFNSANVPDIKYSYVLNQPGWYSYKIVVRQQQQEYYNVYLPGFLNGYPKFQTTSTGITNPTIFPLNELNKTAHTVLLNDNINKIPRDLTEVGPDQKQYRSSVELFGRVENLLETLITSNKQYYPAKKADIASTIASSADLNFLVTNNPGNINGTASNNFYQLSTTPIIARISTVNKIGVGATTATSAEPPVSSKTMNPFLSVYETAPFVSLLDIFWETSSSGLISDLNTDVLTGSDVAVGFDNLIFDHKEFQEPLGSGTPAVFGTETSPYITGYFSPINSLGVNVSVDGMTMAVSDLSPSNTDRTSNFKLERVSFLPPSPDSGKFAIKILNPFVFLDSAGSLESYIFTFSITDAANGNTILTASNSLKNSFPIIVQPPFASTVQTIPINAIIGPIFICVGKNGSPSTQDNAQLKWSISSTTAGFSTYFEIDENSGVISLINAQIPPGNLFAAEITLKDANAGTNSLSALRSVNFEVPVANNFCAQWTSIVQQDDPGGGPIIWSNTIQGYLNFWKLIPAGAKIDINNSDVIIKYETFNGIYYIPTISPGNARKLTFNPNNFEGTFYFDSFQGPTDASGDDDPVKTLTFIGNIALQGGAGQIPININSDGLIDPFSQYSSSASTCFPSYLPSPQGDKKSWKLENSNTTVSISWRALSGDQSEVLGVSPLNSNEAIGSAVYFPTTQFPQPCIATGSLTFGSGGVATFSPC